MKQFSFCKILYCHFCLIYCVLKFIFRKKYVCLFIYIFIHKLQNCVYHVKKIKIKRKSQLVTKSIINVINTF